MTAPPLFMAHVILSLISSTLLAVLFAWPWLRAMPRKRALIWVVAPHTLLRFIGISFLIPGVVSPALSPAFTNPAAYGDLVAGLLAIVATYALAQNAIWAIGAVWVFNLWGIIDFLSAFYDAPHAHINPGQLGAAYFIPTTIVPLLLVTHVLAFRLLVRKSANEPHISRT
jgi:hypothetical protein